MSLLYEVRGLVRRYGRVTALGVHIIPHPTHIAGLPCAVNLNCHVARHATAVL